MTTPGIYIFGASHAVTLAKAAEAFDEVHVYREYHESRAHLAPSLSIKDFVALVSTLDERSLVVSALVGNEHSSLLTMESPIPFSVAIPRKGRVLIPQRVMLSYFDDLLRQREQRYLAAIRKHSKARILQLMPPPPKRSNAMLADYLQRKHALEDVAVAPAKIRLAMWKLYRRAMSEMCTRMRMPLIDPPQRVRDDDGFLRADFAQKDILHANRHYGTAVIEDLLDLWRARLAEAS